MQRDDFKCQQCQRDDQTLNVHHRYYVKGRDPWQYPDFALQTLCEECHGDLHGPLRENEEFGFYEWEDALDFFLGQQPHLAGELWTLAASFAWAEDITPEERFRALHRVLKFCPKV